MPHTHPPFEGFHCPRWEELPSLPLYMDQVMLVLEDSIGLFSDEKEHVLTSSMVNNYVKHGLISAPVKKRYERRHLTALIVVGVLKRVLSMSEITALCALMVDTHGQEAAYDLFCQRLEYTLQAIFSGEEFRLDLHAAAADVALDAALLALAGKLCVRAQLEPPTPQEG